MAKEAGFCQRKTKLDGIKFFKMVLFDHLAIDQPSLQQHSLSIFNDHGQSISKQALDKRFNEHAVIFIQKLFEAYFQHQLSVRIPSEFSKYFTAIRVMDSTEFKLPENLSEVFPGFQGDGTNSCAQIQFEYDLISAQIKHLAIANARTPDFCYASNNINDIQNRNLIIRDLGYCTIDNLKAIETRGAFYINRLNTQMIIYEKDKSTFKELNLKTILGRLKSSRKKYLDIPVYVGKQYKYPVRLIANLLDQSARERRLKKKIFRKNQHNQKYKQLSELNLFITNIPNKILTSQQVYGLYKVRWQIELIFKTWKSVLKIHHVRKMKPERFKCYLFGKLLWILMNWDICMIVNEYILKAKKHFVSLYKCFAIIKFQAIGFKRAFNQREYLLKQWLKNLLEIIFSFGLKEPRQGRISLLNLLSLKY